MTGQFARTQLLLGKAAMERLRESRVAVFGIGGVGGHVCEALARSGIGAFVLVDDDRVSLTNLNRQIIAARSTLGRSEEHTSELQPDVCSSDLFYIYHFHIVLSNNLFRIL